MTRYGVEVSFVWLFRYLSESTTKIAYRIGGTGPLHRGATSRFFTADLIVALPLIKNA